MQFVTAATLVAMLAKAHADGSLDKQLATLSRPKLLIIDELGYLPFKANAAHLFFQLVSRRYEKGSILITSNRSVGEWGSVFGDPVVATAILDRLLHHSTVITIRGDSYRLREKRRSAGPVSETNETTTPMKGVMYGCPVRASGLSAALACDRVRSCIRPSDAARSGR